MIGEGPNLTVLQASAAFNVNNPDMIDMGNVTLCPPPKSDCPAVSVEHLGLDGNSANVNVNGIVNQFAQELSYVNDVAFTNISKTGLEVMTNNAANSGPYSNLTMSNTGTCLAILSGTPLLSGTRGVHGLTCGLSTGSPAGPAIYLDAPNNSLEDISISGTSTQDGILVGSNAPAENNVLFNIRGNGLRNVIHISKTTTASSPPNCPPQADGNKYTVCDVTILGVANSGGTNNIEDELTTPTTTLPDANVGMYIVGEPVNGGSSAIGYSRFTTSPNFNATGAVTWLVGPNSPSPPTGSCATGSLYSCTNNSNCPSTTLWGCAGSGGWNPIK